MTGSRFDVPFWALSAILAGGCDIMSQVPTEDSIRANPGRVFIVAGEDIRGIYGNMDVDSEVYQYRTREENADEFWVAVSKQSAETGWKLVHEEGNVRHYDRIMPATGEEACHSAEQVRIAYDPGSRTVTVAWVQNDVSAYRSKPPTKFGESRNAEVDFADRVIWPKFRELADREK